MRPIREFVNNLSIKEFDKSGKIGVIFTLSYTFLFTIYAMFRGNLEFIFYSVMMLILLTLGIYINRQVHLPAFIMISISLLGFFHILGGNLIFGETRLYDTFFLYNIIRYDNIIHIFGSAVAALVLNTLFFSYSVKKRKIRIGLYYFALILMTLGVGVLNEIMELIAVIYLSAHLQVGDYFNNTVDLVYNLIGALIAIIIIDTYRLYRYIKR